MKLLIKLLVVLSMTVFSSHAKAENLINVLLGGIITSTIHGTDYDVGYVTKNSALHNSKVYLNGVLYVLGDEVLNQVGNNGVTELVVGTAIDAGRFKLDRIQQCEMLRGSGIEGPDC